MTKPQSVAMSNVAMTDIHIGNRYRKTYDNIKHLAHSIKTKGLINPIAVARTESTLLADVDTSKPYVLLAGGRRLQACQSLGWSTIPVRIYEQKLSELDLRSIELAENIDREKMTYAEEVELKAKIHELQQSIHGAKVARSSDAPGWSAADTASLLNETKANLSRDMKLARAIQQFPELGLDKCKNKSEANKMLKKIGSSLATSVASEEFQRTVPKGSKRIQRLIDSYILGDCLETIKSIPSESIHLVEIDPPYAIDLTRQKAGDTDGYNEIEASEYEAFMSTLFKECFRIMRPNSWLLCWYAVLDWAGPVKELITKSGFNIQGNPAIWAKPTGQTMQPLTRMASCYEPFYYAQKGKPTLSKQGRPNIFSFPPVPPQQKYHPTQRPQALMDEVFAVFSKPMNNVYIPFLGSGVSILAADKHQCKVFGNDLTKEYKDGFILNVKATYPEG